MTVKENELGENGDELESVVCLVFYDCRMISCNNYKTFSDISKSLKLEIFDMTKLQF